LGDVQIACPLPGRRHRLELLLHLLAPWPTDALDLEHAADLAAGWSPAQIKGMVGEAAGRALARSGRGTPITQADILESIRGQGHREREDEPELVAERLRIAAAHEAGHIAVSCWLGVPVTAIQLRTSGDGFTQGGREDQPRSEREIRASIIIAFGGVAAERLLLGAASTGGVDDVAKATRLAIGLVEAGLDPDFPPVSRETFSGRAPRTIDEPLGDHVLAVLAQARERAETIVAIQGDAIERLAERLVETPVLAGSALQQAISEAGFGSSSASGEETDPWTFVRSWAAGPTIATSSGSTSPSAAATTTTSTAV
jgi:cell division protease FtsH